MRAPTAGISLFIVLCATAIARGQETLVLTEENTWDVAERVDPASPEGRLDAAREALAADRPERARKLVSAWIDEFPDEPLIPQAYLLRGDALTAQGSYYEALFDYEYIARMYPSSEAFVTALERELDIATIFARGTRRKLFGLRLIDASDEAEELLIRVQERMPGSDLAERAAFELADFYFNRADMELAAEMYSIFLENHPRSPRAGEARVLLVNAHWATFKGPEFDASGLREARAGLEGLIAAEPATAQRHMADAKLASLDELEARKMLVTARWYLKIGDPISSEFTIRRMLERFPRTVAAADGVRLATRFLHRLPASVLVDAPDYRALRDAMRAGTEPGEGDGAG